MKRLIRGGLVLVILVIAIGAWVNSPKVLGPKVSPEKVAMAVDPLWVNGNTHLISQMKYSVDHLSGQVTGMDTWLKMAKDETSLLIYGTWLDQLDREMLAIPEDIAAIRKELGENDQDRVVVLDQFEMKFVKARAFIRFGVKHQNQKAIDNGAVIIKDLMEIMKLKMDWK